MAQQFVFEEATRERLKARIALKGVSGGGKTYTALALATYLLGAKPGDDTTRRIAVIDSERGSSRRYAKGQPFRFSVVELTSFEPENYVNAIKAAEKQGFEIVIVDSLSHEWAGTNGAMEQVDRAAGAGNKFAAWGKVTPRHNAVIDAIMGSTCHVFATMRSKLTYEQDIDKDTGKKTVNKLGLQPVQRDGVEYEFDILLDMTADNVAVVDKTRCSALKGKWFREPGQHLAAIIGEWLDAGEEAPPVPPAPIPPQPPARPAAMPPREPAPAGLAPDVAAVIARIKAADSPDALDAIRADLNNGARPATGAADIRAALGEASQRLSAVTT